MSEKQKRSLIEKTLYPSKRKLGVVDRFSGNIRKNGKRSNGRHQVVDSKNMNKKQYLKSRLNEYRRDRCNIAKTSDNTNNYEDGYDDEDEDDVDDDGNEVVYPTKNAIGCNNYEDDDDDTNIDEEEIDCDGDNDDDCDNECDDDDDDNNDMRRIDGRQMASGFNDMDKNTNRNITINDSAVIKLPGGSAIPMAIKNLDCSIGEVPSEYVKYVRDYMDILFSSVAFEASSLIQMDKMESIFAIPGIVNAILEYNNISFANIKYCKTAVELFEPIWYTYNIAKSELVLYFNDVLYDRFCMESDDKPVLFTSGVVPIDLLNPYENDPNHEMIDSAMIHAAIAADHVAQHIISDICQPDKPQCASIHDKFTDYGTTLTSMFFIEQNSIPMPKREYNNYMTMTMNYPTMSNSNYGISNSTQNLLNTILTPHQNSNQINQQSTTLLPMTDTSQIYDNNNMPSFRYTV
ncbi:GrBNV_gp13-like protein [Drosophila innubila nudivirus]|uniref:GrBNV_gp13-like protein n=1 Tax=Drosophila innubila nudivirus TaxID=2057187 RepID=A0A2H4UXA5_9VIRU|nr:GrBNV_gp13-like protein [Drosophila innubila nudivirus]ATZ81544.1 GrBNV_gp13-like protein [Drosophila innubila nudivirus]